MDLSIPEVTGQGIEGVYVNFDRLRSLYLLLVLHSRFVDCVLGHNLAVWTFDPGLR